MKFSRWHLGCVGDVMRQSIKLGYTWEALTIVIFAVAGAASLVGAHFLWGW